MSYLLILIVAVSVLVMLSQAKKRNSREREEFAAKSTMADVRSEEAASAGAHPEEKKTPASPSAAPVQHTIYEFSSGSKSRLCPFCDGENGVDAKICIICGQII